MRREPWPRVYLGTILSVKYKRWLTFRKSKQNNMNPPAWNELQQLQIEGLNSQHWFINYQTDRHWFCLQVKRGRGVCLAVNRYLRVTEPIGQIIESDTGEEEGCRREVSFSATSLSHACVGRSKVLLMSFFFIGLYNTQVLTTSPSTKFIICSAQDHHTRMSWIKQV